MRWPLCSRGSTREVAEVVAATLLERGFEVDLRPAREVADLSGYDGVVLGGALYMGRWHGDARRFLERHRQELAERPLAVFGMGPLTLAQAQVDGSRKQLEGALGHVPEVEPRWIAIFGGVVDPAKLHFPFNHMPASDARDWSAIHEWAYGIATELEQARVA